MKPIEFPQHNHVWAKDQEGFKPLPAYVDDRQTISCWALTWRERITMFVRGRLWLRQQNFGRALQGQMLQVDSPFPTTKSREGK